MICSCNRITGVLQTIPVYLARSTPVERLPWQTGKQQAWIGNSVAMSPQFEDVTNGIYSHAQ
jgi:hypothetical protein